MGHSSITVTFDLYGHLMPGAEAEAADLLDAYLDAQISAGEQTARGERRGCQLGYVLRRRP